MKQPSKNASILAMNAKGDSVSKKKLTGNVMTAVYLSENSAIDYLNENEQPHYFLYSSRRPITYDGETVATGMTTNRSLVVTDQRILVIVTTLNDESVWEIPYDSVENANSNKGTVKHIFSIRTPKHHYEMKFPTALFGPFGFEYSEIRSATSYIQNRSESMSDADNKNKNFEDEKMCGGPFTDLRLVSPQIITNNMVDNPKSSAEQDLDEDTVNAEVQELADNAEGDSVTYEALLETRIVAALDNNEQPHHLLQGNAILIKSGNNVEKKGGAGGSVTTSVTNNRILSNVEGEGIINIPYDSITSVEYGLPPEDEWEINIPVIGDFSGQTEKLIIHTQGRVYYFDLSERLGIFPDSWVEQNQEDHSEYVFDVINFIRNKREEVRNRASRPEPEPTESDPLDQIERLKKLNAQGTITDKEFEEKKSDLLDQL